MNKTGFFFTALNSTSATAFYEAVSGRSDKLNYDRGNVRVKKQNNAVISLSRFKREEEPDMGDIRMTDAALNKPFHGLYRKNIHTEYEEIIFHIQTTPGVYDLYLSGHRPSRKAKFFRDYPVNIDKKAYNKPTNKIIDNKSFNSIYLNGYFIF